VVRTYAPCSETPVLKVFQTRDHLSVMSGISTAWAPGNPNAHSGADRSGERDLSTSPLYGYLGRRLLVIWDNATIHRSDEVKAFLANGWATKIHLENFPAYAPELNPDEGVWQYLKHIELRSLCCMDLIHLNIELQLAIRRLRRKQDLIQSFFAGADLDLRG
jgi:transposase